METRQHPFSAAWLGPLFDLIRQDEFAEAYHNLAALQTGMRRAPRQDFKLTLVTRQDSDFVHCLIQCPRNRTSLYLRTDSALPLVLSLA